MGGDALMGTTARLDDLKRDPARLQRKRTGSPRQGRTVDEGGRGREAEHPGKIPSRGWMVLLTWLYLSTLLLPFGAAINAQSEKQTRHDSTEGPPRPMGARDARAADTLGESRHQRIAMTDTE
jgi:hypothetical protein